MVWKKFFSPKEKVKTELPHRFNASTMIKFIDDTINKQTSTKCKKIYVSFSTLVYIEPIGVVVLSNLIEYFDKIKVDVVFEGHNIDSEANFFLDRIGFFQHHLKEKYSNENTFKSNYQSFSCKNLQLVSSKEATEYLYFNLMPWIEREVGLMEGSLAPLKTSIEEIFHNIRDHSGVKMGYVFAQKFQKRSEIQIVISDFGVGIPSLVRKKMPNIVQDSDALFKACEEGFSTQSNVRNRGAGLSNLIRYITLRNTGTVLIISGKAQVLAVKNKNSISSPKIKTTKHDVTYPGTLVRVVLRTDIFEQLIEDTEEEIFEW